MFKFITISFTRLLCQITLVHEPFYFFSFTKLACTKLRAQGRIVNVIRHNNHLKNPVLRLNMCKVSN